MTSPKPPEQKNSYSQTSPQTSQKITIGYGQSYTLPQNALLQSKLSQTSVPAVVNTLSIAQDYLQQAKQAFRANQFLEVGRLTEACIAAAPDDDLRLDAKGLMASALLMMQRTEQALAILQEVNASRPDDVNTLANIGLANITLKRFDDAIHYLQRTVALAPEDAVAYFDLGFAAEQDHPALAKASYLKAFSLDPKMIQARFNLGRVYQAEGQIAQAEAIYTEILAKDPNNLRVLGQAASMLHLMYPLNMPQQLDIAQRFGMVLSRAKPSVQHASIQSLVHQRPLRVGFVSADLREHPVAFFLLNTLKALRLDPTLNSQLTLVAYHQHSVQDSMSAELAGYFEHWYQVQAWPDDHLIAQIQHDQIDILIDLSGHTRDHRLSVFARKAAPLQISWLGYFGTTGLTEIDYVLADALSVPQSEERWFVEQIWRMPNLRYCLSIPAEAPQVSPLPCLKSSKIVFGCYQKWHKINDGVLRCWSKILAAAPQACLRIQSRGLEKIDIRAAFVERLQNFGVDMAQIEFVDPVSRKDYLASYAAVDILLDTFPYPGGTTTAEALWMGVPTLTLALPSMLGRQGEAFMVAAGLPEWVVHREEEYVQRAILWAHADQVQRQVLANLRASMRERVRISPVFDAAQFARDFLTALQGMWQKKNVR